MFHNHGKILSHYYAVGITGGAFSAMVFLIPETVEEKGSFLNKHVLLIKYFKKAFLTKVMRSAANMISSVIRPPPSSQEV